jgi:hypothetical protein
MLISKTIYFFVFIYSHFAIISISLTLSSFGLNVSYNSSYNTGGFWENPLFASL